MAYAAHTTPPAIPCADGTRHRAVPDRRHRRRVCVTCTSASHEPGSRSRSTGVGWDYGTELGYLRELVDYWRDTYDWRRAEARLNRFHHFRHARSTAHASTSSTCARRSPTRCRWSSPTAGPARSWSSSTIIGPLSDPRGARWRPGRRVPRRRARRSPVTRSPGRPTTAAGTRADRARRWAELMAGARLRPVRRPGRRLGLDGLVAARRGRCRARRRRPPEHGRGGATARHRLREARRRRSATRSRRSSTTGATSRATRASREHDRRRIGYSLDDSPVGLAAWIVEKFRAWSDCDGDVERSFTKDQLLDNVMLYWLTATAHSAARLYYEVQHGGSALARQPRGAGRGRRVPPRSAADPTALGRDLLQHRALDRHAPWWALRRVRGTRVAPGGNQGILRAPPLAAMSTRGTTTRSVVARACARNVTDGSFGAG